MKRILLSAISALMFLSMQAQTMSFLNVNPDASVSALAGAGVAASADAYASENNVASVALSESRMAISAGYSSWQPKASNSTFLSAAAFYRVNDKFGLSLSFKDMIARSYTLTSQTGIDADMFTPAELSAGLGLAYRLAEHFSAGLNLKLTSSTLAPEAKAMAFAADLACMYSNSGFRAGLSLNNIGGKVNYGTSSWFLPMVAKAGASYSIAGFTGCLELDYLVNSGVMAAMGVEYDVAGVVALRAGYHYGDKAKTIPSYASIGLGVHLAGVSFNAAYLLASDTLSGSVMLGLGYSF